jgi:hypothetical protein
VTLGSCDSPRIARPGRSGAPRFGLLLGLLGVAVGLVVGCVDQPLIPVNEPAATGGSSSTTASGNGGSATGGSSYVSSGSGGWFGSGGNGQTGGSVGSGGQSTLCHEANQSCGAANGCCGGKGLLCLGGNCCVDIGQSCRDGRDCCVGTCGGDGKCARNVSIACVASGYRIACNENSNCCSRNCDINGSWTCLEIEGCKPFGEYCTRQGECCSGYCIGSSVNYGTCQVCGQSGRSCKVDVDCCDGYQCLASSRTCALKTATNACGLLGANCVNASAGTGGTSGAAGSSSTSASTCCSGYVCDLLTSKCVR